MTANQKNKRWVMKALVLVLVLSLGLITNAEPGGKKPTPRVTKTEVELLPLPEAPKPEPPPEAPAPSEVEEPGPAPEPETDPEPEPELLPPEPPKGSELPTKPPEPPQVLIVAPETVNRDNIIHIELEFTGGPVRETEVTFDPPIAPTNLVTCGGEEVGATRHYYFTGKPGIYTIRVLCIGAEKGFSRQEARMRIVDPNPPKPVAAKEAEAIKPEDLMRQWVSQVNSANKREELKVIVTAAREAARAIKDNNIPERAMDEWTTAAYLKMGTGVFSPWNISTGDKKSFFANMTDLFNDNAKQPGSSPANLLENLANILESLK